ncbi:DUF4251 domain-containing protein [Sediminibacterium soli]|uniref:DUF4251 domain-containing protein n=1 Tax=Sediminibacterium soli TaxID=2698829 RepID=UPI00137B693C|nr:DUF4251 domain-containing protein [Sediminibacterium soli]NCI46766.1 DUF4251 domain-containing protein [Sediminibacterium soli]
MRTHRYSTLLVCLVAAFTVTGELCAQDTQIYIANCMRQKKFAFQAQLARPADGSNRVLSTEYRMDVSPDSISVVLPYFGQSYKPSTGLTDGSIRFVSRKFDYTAEQGKRGKWVISIKPKDATDVQQMVLTLFDDGTGLLQVTSTTRQPISYAGRLTD